MVNNSGIVINSGIFLPAFFAFVIVFMLSAVATVVNKKAPEYTKALSLFTNTAGILVGGYFMYQYFWISPEVAISKFYALVIVSVFGTILYSSIKFFDSLPNLFK